MAKNRKFEVGNRLTVPMAGVSVGDPVVYGDIPGVALTDTDADGNIVMQTDGVFELAVKGANNAGNTAIDASVANIVYLDGAELNVDATNGIRFGYTLGDVASGATETELVKIGY